MQLFNPVMTPEVALMIKRNELSNTEDIAEAMNMEYDEVGATFTDGLTCSDVPETELNDGTPLAELILAAAGYVSSEAEPKHVKRQRIYHKRYDPKQKRWFVDTEERYVDVMFADMHHPVLNTTEH